MKLNNELSLRAPEGFRELTAEEKRKIQAEPDTRLWGVKNDERHAVLVVYWKQYGALTSLLIGDLKALVKGNARKSGKLYSQYQYQEQGVFSRPVAGKEAWGYRFSFHANDADHVQQTVLLKQGRTVYNFSFTCLKVDAAALEKLFFDVLDSVTIG